MADTASEEGGQGWYVIHCNVEWAKVYLDDKYVGETTLGALTVQVPAGSSYQKIRVQKHGYATFTDSLVKSPLQDEIVHVYTAISPLPETTEAVDGGDMGWYVVHCNIEGATVFFDGLNKGEITRGVVYVPVYSTATPYREFTVKKDGYFSYTGSVPTVPGKGETFDLYATLNPTTAPSPGSTIGGDIGYYKVNGNVDGATVFFDKDEKGTIEQGSLLVQVYVTGTPYKTFTVTKSGYLPYTGSIERYPVKGETVNLYATLATDLSAPSSSETTPVQKSSLLVWATGIALMIAAIAVSRAQK
ncbi:PEGA domain-containing protein [Methanoregula sp.]|uniref:PEGA domain-containing protein n=1 Tax=Methanoregula sp. TaxID=2052170 RepID=UPI00262E6A7F|nr:PEGA domain-containing protein [Methanoregula sp.]MDD5143172.1 PEGA domain-containing protein [Methanoregula sp.]